MSRAALIGAILLLAPVAVVTWSGRPAEAPRVGEELGRKIPRLLGPWVGADKPLDEGTLRLLRTDDYVHRTYTASGRPPVDLTVVFSRRERKTVHPPEICFEAQGWELEERSVAPRSAGETVTEAATLRLFRDGRRMDCVYWFATGEVSTASFVRQQVQVAWASLRGEEAGSALVRFTAVSALGGDREATRAALDDLVREALPHLATAFR